MLVQAGTGDFVLRDARELTARAAEHVGHYVTATSQGATRGVP